MKRSGPLRRSAPARRRARPLPARSAKREAVAAERREFVERILRARPWCEACSTLWPLECVPRPRGRAREAVDVHEPWLRSARGPIVPSQGLTEDMVLCLCRHCHDWIHGHPEAAYALGLLVHSWETTKPPRLR